VVTKRRQQRAKVDFRVAHGWRIRRSL
jgi:hypothetical protein